MEKLTYEGLEYELSQANRKLEYLSRENEELREEIAAYHNRRDKRRDKRSRGKRPEIIQVPPGVESYTVF